MTEAATRDRPDREVVRVDPGGFPVVERPAGPVGGGERTGAVARRLPHADDGGVP